ncbi:MAG: hypothetical protein AABX54_05810 [Nanoarchaeota archaeon]
MNETLNYGFRIRYYKAGSSPIQGLSVRTLNALAERIEREWVNVTYKEDRINRTDGYILSENYVEVNKRVDRSLEVDTITFVSETQEGLEKAVETFRLPFSKTQIIATHK